VVEGSVANYVSNTVIGAAIGGGGATNFNGNRYSNSVSASFGTVGGGAQNLASGFAATVSGGENNIASGPLDAVVAGGANNTASASRATVSGGLQNTASGSYSTVPGGYNSTASGNVSFAAGSSAQALHSGSFVWSDGSGGTFASTADNQFSVRAAGGVVFAGDLLLAGGASYHNISMSGGNSIGYLYGSYNPPTSLGDGIHLGYNWYADANGVSHIPHPGGPTSRITAGYGEIVLAVGGPDAAPSTMLHVTTSGVCVQGAVGNCSDRNVKQDVAPVSPAKILDRVLSLPVSEWSYKFDATTRHIGPMAQDFYSAFNVGQDEKHITTIDESGVALAAIQGLNQKVEEREAKIRSQSVEIAELKHRLDALETLLRNQTSR
jgi:hypothetical protein